MSTAVYTKAQKRCRRGNTSFNSGRGQSHREEERRNERNEKKQFNKAVKNINPAKDRKAGLISKLMKRFNRSN